MSLPITSLQHCIGSLRQCNTARESINIGKKEVKLSLSSAAIIVSVENLRKSTSKLLELINELNKVI